MKVSDYWLDEYGTQTVYYGDIKKYSAIVRGQFAEYAFVTKMEPVQMEIEWNRISKSIVRRWERFYGLDNKYTGSGKLRV